MGRARAMVKPDALEVVWEDLYVLMRDTRAHVEAVSSLLSASPARFFVTRIYDLELSVRSANCLQSADLLYVGELVQRTESEMLRLKNFGRKSLDEIREILGAMGLCFGMRLFVFPERSELDAMRTLVRWLDATTGRRP